jgi:4-amino-4-deoxy-L-arabinose transferase-like glycosyltransferase
MSSNDPFSRWRWPLAAAGLFLLFFLRLGATPLLDPDEPVYGQIAREMATTGQWLTPHLAGRPWFDKPPLYYWASAASMAGLGPSELAARLPSALAAVLLVALVLVLGRRLFSGTVGWTAALVVATSLQTIILGRAAVTDMLFALTLMAALGAFALWYAGQGRPRAWAALCGACLGLAVLCKGPVAILLLGAAAIVFLLWERRLRLLWGPDLPLALLCCLLVGAPWYAAMLRLHRHEFMEQFIVANNLRRFAQAEHPENSTPVLYFVPVLLVGLFPWTAFLPQAVAAGRVTWAGRLLLTWSAVVFLFFSVSSTKLVTYIYPLYPALALLIGAALTGRGAGIDIKAPIVDGDASRLFRPAMGTLVLGWLLAAGLIALVARQYPSALAGTVILGAILMAGTALGVWAARAGRPPVGAYAVTMVGVAVTLGGLVAPRVAPSVSQQELVRWADATGRPLVAYRLRSPGFLFYSGRELPYEQQPEALARRARSVPGLAVAMSRRALPEVMAANPDLEWRVILRWGNRIVAEPVWRRSN